MNPTGSGGGAVEHSLLALPVIGQEEAEEPGGRTPRRPVTLAAAGSTTQNGHNGHPNGHAAGRDAHAEDAPTAVPNSHVAGTVPGMADAMGRGDDAALVISERAREFRDRVFPGATDAQWNDWKWQLRNRINDLPRLEKAFALTQDERRTVLELGDRLPVGITPHYATTIDPNDPLDGIRKTMIPVGDEFVMDRGELADPLNEDGDMPVPGLVHRYPDRVLFLVTSFCATYCRYCTRSRLVGKTGEYHFNYKQFERAIQYIEATPEIRDVLISGGDPLTMADDRIEWLLSRLRAIPHIEFIRIGSKVPAVLPQRITPKLCTMLKKFHPFWMSIHFMHPNEITPEVAEACGRLADSGIPLGSQTVLTAGVNDTPEVMKRLMHGLLKIRVRPYYIYQCDPIPGSRHFRTPVETGLRIIEALRGHTTGYAVPTFVIDGPGGGGKIPLMPEYMVGREGDDVILRNFEGQTFRYPDPLPRGV